MSNILIFSHIGLGDQLIMNGYINYIFETQNINNLCLVARKFHMKTLNHLYKKYIDQNRFSFFFFEDDSENVFLDKKPFNTKITLNNTEYSIHSFGVASDTRYFLDNFFWVDSFYIQAGLDPIIRFSYFRFPDDLSESLNNYNRLLKLINNQKYILIHDDPSRGHHIDRNKLVDILTKNSTFDLPIIYLGFDRYNFNLVADINNIYIENNTFNLDSVLNYYHIIKNCEEGHFMESSIIFIANNIKDTNSKYYCHDYIRNGSAKKILNQKFTIIY